MSAKRKRTEQSLHAGKTGARLGAVVDGEGVAFSLISRNAEAVELCLFDSAEAVHESRNIPLQRIDAQTWSVHVPGLASGQLYGYRVHGRFAPVAGHWFNPSRLLFDPYARAVGRVGVSHRRLHYTFASGAENSAPPLDKRDTAPFAPLACVADGRFDWDGDRKPETPWHDTVLYEAHVKGMTARHPDIPADKRGTYAALAEPCVIEHFRKLGVTAVELLPVQLHWDELRLNELGMTNYWGYNTLNYFIPDPRFVRPGDDPVTEFKAMVRNLHRAGIEVILDIAFNHTAEGGQHGPTLSFRGIDNRLYYRLDPERPMFYRDFSGCGNTLDATQPAVLDLIVDSLRYWAEEMRVDGFRFDLAAALGRDPERFDPESAFFSRIHDDPVLSKVKLIAEPWDLGPDSYQLGNFPPPWREWNGRFRDDIRRFWKGDRQMTGAFATRFSGSSDLFHKPHRTVLCGINFITCHDGFTLNDLVSYSVKHNEKNLEDNRDGHNDSHSWNCGVEGPTTDADILARRQKHLRNLAATLALAPGVPMLLGGDETLHSQGGNNNAYCQDHSGIWLDWEWNEPRLRFHDFVCQALQLRKSMPGLFGREKFFTGKKSGHDEFKDLAWLSPEGREMRDGDWADPARRSLGILFAWRDKQEPGERLLLILAHAGSHPLPFHLPKELSAHIWRVALDTHDPERASATPEGKSLPGSGALLLPPESMLVLRSG